MKFAHPLTHPAPRPRHPLADAGRAPKPVAVVILVVVLTMLGWTEEQILALLAGLFPLSLTAGRESRA